MLSVTSPQVSGMRTGFWLARDCLSASFMACIISDHVVSAPESGFDLGFIFLGLIRYLAGNQLLLLEFRGYRLLQGICHLLILGVHPLSR